MGSDKALLVFRGSTLLERAASIVRQTFGSVTVIGDPGRYQHLGLPVIADDRAGCGPLGGVVTALRHSESEWNVMLACDMPDIDAATLEWLAARALASADEVECVVPLSDSGPQPLCAVYRSQSGPKLLDALDRGVLKMRSALSVLKVRYLPARDRGVFANINTPEDWAAHE